MRSYMRTHTIDVDVIIRSFTLPGTMGFQVGFGKNGLVDGVLRELQKLNRMA